MKTTGALWNEYLASWPDGQWFDDSDETFNGKSDVDPVPDDAVVEFSCGVVFKSAEDREGVSLVTHFRRWLKVRDHLTFVVTVPRGAEAQFRDAMAALGGTVR